MSSEVGPSVRTGGRDLVTQASMCYLMMEDIMDHISTHTSKRYNEYAITDGATKTQIKSDIVRLRRELLRVSKMLG